MISADKAGSMKSILDAYVSFFNKLKNDRIPTFFCVNIHNEIILNLELLDSYASKWNKSYNLTSKEIEEERKTNAQRIVRVNKNSFVAIMGLFEYDLREFIKHTEESSFEELRNKLHSGKFVNLSEILKKLKNTSRMSEEDYETIYGITVIRNIIVHNDARPTDMNINESLKTLFLTYEVGKQLSGDFLVFLELLKKIYDSYANWYQANQEIYSSFVPEQPDTQYRILS